MIMRTNWIRTLTLSAVAVAMGSASYGQSRAVAEIPFSFRLNGMELPAGTYSIDRPNSAARNVVRLTDGRKNQVAMAITEINGKPGQPRLIFSCFEGSGCALVQVWNSGGVGLEFAAPKVSSIEKERIATVWLRSSKAD
jgi:hypothetical protein